MTDLQAYISFIIAFIIAFVFIAFFFKNFNVLVRIVIALLVVKTVYYGSKLLLLPVKKGEFLTKLFSYKYIYDVVYAGIFLGGLAAWFLVRRNSARQILLQSKALYKYLIPAISITFIYSAAGAMWGYSRSLAFFKSCGYTESFMIFIIVVELVCGVAVLFKKTRLIALSILIADMAGATTTHFKNYIFSGLPDPLGNSLPSLAMLTFLFSVIILMAENGELNISFLNIKAGFQSADTSR